MATNLLFFGLHFLFSGLTVLVSKLLPEQIDALKESPDSLFVQHLVGTGSTILYQHLFKSAGSLHKGLRVVLPIIELVFAGR